ncbi:MAG: phosphatase PAP2/dual specificity phosphatase family protein [Tepidisphaeraceae bacterium]
MRGFWKSAATSAALSALFLVVYGGCNFLASRRSDVGSFYFSWERHMPFVPALILPYMSIDLFFVGAPFLARSDRERQVLAARITLAILLAGVCFLLFPLKFAFERPHVDGVLGVIFNNFRTVDRPFNQCPSLHIALCIILIDIYNRHTRGHLRGLLAVWFVLIAVSPLLTYQHHFIDVIGGFLLAAICFHLCGEQPLRQPFVPNRRIAIYYAVGAAVLLALAFAWMPWSGLLLWPAFSAGFASAGYLFLGPGIYRKENGAISWTPWVLMWPVLLGQRFSLWHYARQCRPYDCVTDRLWIGRRLSGREATEIQGAGVTAVIDLAGEFSEPLTLRNLAYVQLSILDLTPPTTEQTKQAIAFIKANAERGIVYVHCKIGYSRTAAIAGAYLIDSGEAETARDALAMLRRARPSIIVRPEAVKALENFQIRREIAVGKLVERLKL